jgi:hypothetical protein
MVQQMPIDFVMVQQQTKVMMIPIMTLARKMRWENIEISKRMIEHLVIYLVIEIMTRNG